MGTPFSVTHCNHMPDLVKKELAFTGEKPLAQWRSLFSSALFEAMLS